MFIHMHHKGTLMSFNANLAPGTILERYFMTNKLWSWISSFILYFQSEIKLRKCFLYSLRFERMKIVNILDIFDFYVSIKGILGIELQFSLCINIKYAPSNNNILFNFDGIYHTYISRCSEVRKSYFLALQQGDRVFL